MMTVLLQKIASKRLSGYGNNHETTLGSLFIGTPCISVTKIMY